MIIIIIKEEIHEAVNAATSAHAESLDFLHNIRYMLTVYVIGKASTQQ